MQHIRNIETEESKRDARWNGARTMGDLKSTHLFEAGGHHDLAFGWHPEYVTFDQERWYSGPLGARGIPSLNPQSGD